MILLTPDLNLIPHDILSDLPKIEIPFPKKNEYEFFLKNIYHELNIRHKRILKFDCNPEDIISQFEKYCVSLNEVRRIRENWQLN